MNLLFILLSGVVGLVLGILVMFGISKAGLNKDQQKAAQILEQADIQADAKVKQAILDGRTQVHELKIEAEKEIKERRQEITEMENKLLRREDNLNFRDETLAAKEKQIDRKSTQLSEKLASLDEKEKEMLAFLVTQERFPWKIMTENLWSGITPISYSSVGKEDGWMPGITADRIIVKKDGKVLADRKGMLGITARQIFRDAAATVLLPADIFSIRRG